MTSAKIAWRSILSHGRRSSVTIATIATGVAATVIFGGFFQANYAGLRESVIRSQYGHLQIQREGWDRLNRTAPDSCRLESAELERIDSLLKSDPRVLVSSRRIETSGLLGNAAGSQAAMVRGVDPGPESMINSSLTIVDGIDLADDDTEGILLGKGLAEAIGVKPGDHLDLLGTTTDGRMNAVDVKVSGIFQSFAKEFDDRAAITTLNRTQSLLGGNFVDKVVVLLSETDEVDAFLADFGAKASKAGLHLEYRSWHQLASFYQKVVDLYDSFFLIINLVVTVIILFGIWNTMSMAVVERTREIGVLRAVGTRRDEVVRLFLLEGIFLGILGCAAGIALGNGTAAILNHLQIMMPPPPGSSQGYPLRILYVPSTWLVSTAVVLAVALVSSYLPARRASRQEIVEAMRFV